MNFHMISGRLIHFGMHSGDLFAVIADYGHDKHVDFGVYSENRNPFDLNFSLTPGDSSNRTAWNVSLSHSVNLSDPNFQSNPIRYKTYTDDAIFVNSVNEVEITTGKDSVTAFCPPLSVSEYTYFTYEVEPVDPSQNLNYTFASNYPTRNLTITSPKRDEDVIVNSEFILTSTDSTGNRTWTHTIKVTESPKKEGFPMAKILQRLTFIFGIFVSLLSAVLGGSLIQGVWMVFNQQKMLILFLLVDIYFDSEIEFIIQQQSFVMMNLDIVSGFLPEFISHPFFSNELMNNPQTSDPLKGLGFESQSAFREYWKFFLGIFVLINLHFLSSFIRNVYYVCKNRQKKAKEIETEEEECEGGSSEESKGHYESSERFDDLNADPRDFISQRDFTPSKSDEGKMSSNENNLEDSSVEEE